MNSKMERCSPVATRVKSTKQTWFDAATDDIGPEDHEVHVCKLLEEDELLLNQNCKQLWKLTFPLMAEGTQVNRQVGVPCMKIILTN
jgi:hypothetical protein